MLALQSLLSPHFGLSYGRCFLLTGSGGGQRLMSLFTRAVCFSYDGVFEGDR
jgi:hypothetical protein